MSEILSVKHIVKTYGANRALVDASLAIAQGEVHGLVGANGAGKSTLIKILAGVVHRDAGSITVGGAEVGVLNERVSTELGLRFVHQDLGIVGRLSVAENVFLGRRLPHVGPFVSMTAACAEAALVLEGFIDIDPKVRMDTLSVSQRWMVAIARACVGKPRLVAMDEPTVALSRPEAEKVFETVRKLKSYGIAVLFVSHRLREVLELTDQVSVMRDGRVVERFPVAELTPDRLVRLIVGDRDSPVFPKSSNILPREDGNEHRPPVMKVKGLSGGPLSGVSFDVRPGEILGLAGLVGSGRTSVLEQVFGVHSSGNGTVAIDGERADIRSPADAVSLGMGMIQESRLDGVLASRTIRENVVLAHMSRFRWRSFLAVPSRRREVQVTNQLIEALSIRAIGSEQVVGELSGGNQQKVLVARWLCTSGLRVLLLDEPTNGIDAMGRAEIHKLLQELAAEGVGVVMVSSDLEELAGACHRAIVIVEGQSVGELIPPMTEADILERCYAA
jgi:ABC-type sugar transport system ATPase subunit